MVQSLTWGAAAVMAIWAISLTSPLVVTLAVAMQIVFLLIGQYTVLSDIQPGIGNWVELFGKCCQLVAVADRGYPMGISSNFLSLSFREIPSKGSKTGADPELLLGGGANP